MIIKLKPSQIEQAKKQLQEICEEIDFREVRSPDRHIKHGVIVGVVFGFLTAIFAIALNLPLKETISLPLLMPVFGGTLGVPAEEVHDRLLEFRADRLVKKIHAATTEQKNKNNGDTDDYKRKV